MSKILGEEYDVFLASYDDEPASGLRINPLKVDRSRFGEIYKTLENVPWADGGYYVSTDEDEKAPSKHPYYYAGLYYLQEPSAMAPGALMPLTEGCRVLDLCAAPGGKSTQIGARLAGKGILVSNDISASRARALLKNIELFGIGNVLILSESPDRLAEVFTGYFDRIIIDAPCSGEGMFRKVHAVAKNWEQYGSGYYADLQKQIVPCAIEMLTPGGIMVYSTCTFSPLEDEETLRLILKDHPDMHVIPFPEADRIFGEIGFVRAGNIGEFKVERSEGEDQNDLRFNDEISNAARLYPHKIKGEGHFVALLRKDGPGEIGTQALSRVSEGPENEETTASREIEAVATGTGYYKNSYDASVRRRHRDIPDGAFDFFEKIGFKISADKLYVKAGFVSLDPEPQIPYGAEKLRTLRRGLLLGEIKKDRFEPSQALACAMPVGAYENTVDFPSDSEDVIRYLKCETISVVGKNAEAEDGYVLVCTDGFPLGWARKKGETLKNRYLPGWRMM
ncbi:MAG: RsmB/NOP family class I SAM-dependent RNA methyltransferase [Lachnospiraceae bacterium]|nr:RsmB/NOP family class I SAM-dependent RNA methyltransferase [Lachnospiraceae bacterium]